MAGWGLNATRVALGGLTRCVADAAWPPQADAALAEFLVELKDAPSVSYGRLIRILVGRAASPDEFTRLTAITWIHDFIGAPAPFHGVTCAQLLPALLRAHNDLQRLLDRGSAHTPFLLKGSAPLSRKRSWRHFILLHKLGLC